jgi:hypothetical protein
MTTDRRAQGKLDLDPDQGVLVVGQRTAVLDSRPPAEAVIGTYVELVVAQRAVKPASRADLRDRELTQLAQILELPADELDALLDRELARLLGGDAPSRSRRKVLAFGALAVVAAAIAAAAATGGDAQADADPPAPTPTSTVETITLPDGSTVVRTESAPAEPQDGIDIGSAVVYERQP